MRESTEITRKKFRASVAELEFSVKAKKNTVSDRLEIYRVAARAVNLDTKRYITADKAYAAAATAKNETRWDLAKENLLVSVASYQEAGTNLNAAVDAVRAEYAALAEISPSPEKVDYDCERYCQAIDNEIVKIQALTDGIEIPDQPVQQIMDKIYNNEPEEQYTAPAKVQIPNIPEMKASPVRPAAPAYEPAPAPTYEPAPVYEAPRAPVYEAPRAPVYEAPKAAAYEPAPVYEAPKAAPAYEAPKAPAYEAPAYEAPKPQTRAYDSAAPKIAPVVVDVSSVVEKAIVATMQKFSMAFDRRIEAFIAEHPVNIPLGNCAPTQNNAAADGATPALVSRTYGADEILALESTILDDEKFLIEKLTDMMENLKELTEAMANVAATYAQLADKQSDINAVQKQTNDMQRHTLREQQGIQVSQRVITQDQIAIAQDQALLTEQQATVKERQQSVAEAQLALEETQRVVMDNQSALEKAMSSVMKTQKDLIAAHQAVVAGNNKNVELQKEVSDKQAETLELQKEALVAQKQILREQKATGEKQKNLGQKKPKAQKPEAAEASAETDAQ